MKKLNAPGKLENTYNYKHDVLTFKIRNRAYKKSVEFQNFTIDIDEEGFVTGVRIFDASTLLKVDKYALLRVFQSNLKAEVQNNVVTLTLNFNVKIRNKIIPLLSSAHNFTQQFTTSAGSANLADATVESAVA